MENQSGTPSKIITKKKSTINNEHELVEKEEKYVVKNENSGNISEIKVQAFPSSNDQNDDKSKQSNKFYETKTVTTTKIRKNPDGSYSKITKTTTCSTKTLVVNTEVITNEDNNVEFKSMKNEVIE